MGRSYRKRHADDEADAVTADAPDEQPLAPGELHRRLADTRRAQAERLRGRGLDAASLLGAPPGSEATAAPAAALAAASELALAARGGLGAQFDVETRAAPAADAAMQRFIDEEMAKRRGGGSAGGTVGDDAPRAAAAADADDGADRWLTGIQEVELPLESRLKSLEAAERAKQAALRGEAPGGGRRRGGARAATDELAGVRFHVPRDSVRTRTKGM